MATSFFPILNASWWPPGSFSLLSKVMIRFQVSHFSEQRPWLTHHGGDMGHSLNLQFPVINLAILTSALSVLFSPGNDSIIVTDSVLPSSF